jgi:N-methylhydantoinase B
VEVAERNSPLFFHYKRMSPGSGGAGRFRGGLGQEMRIENESPTPIVMSFMAERTTYPAPGLAGGGAGGRGEVRLNGKRIDNRKQYMLRKGDTVLLRTPGGGGYGPTRQRDKALARRDRTLGYLPSRKP